MKTYPARLVLSALAGLTPAFAAVPAAQVTLGPVASDNLPILTTLCGYEIHESSSTNWTNKEVPLYQPYNFEHPAMWDNIVAEVLQARLPAIMVATRGAWTTSPADLEGPGNMNPRNLRKLVQAIQRARAEGILKITCFVDSPAMRGIYTTHYGLPSSDLFDFANTDGWEQIVWRRTVKPWFDSVPSNHWFRINNRPVITWWGFHPGWATNHAGNAGPMFQYISDAFLDAYGVRPWFILPSDIETSSNQDPGGAANQADVLGLNPWFATPNQAARYHTHKGFTTGTAVPGFIDPYFFDPASPNHLNYNRVIFRNNITGTGANGDTLKDALSAGVTANARFTILEGWTDQAEWAGFYRSLDDKWTTPNHYIDIVRSFSDLRTTSLRLEAEGADTYNELGAGGNTGGSFLRSGETLDVRALSGAPAFTASTEASASQSAAHGLDGKLGTRWQSAAPAPGWLQFDAGQNNSHVVTGYHLTSADLAARDPSAWQLQGSNNGISWTTLDTRSGQSFSARRETKSFTFANTAAYRYHRLNVTATAGGGSNAIALAELTLDPITQSHGGGWAVTDTVAGEWIQFHNFTFSPGNYRFAVRYSSAASGKRLRLHVNGVAQSIVTLPATGGANTFDTIDVGQATFTAPRHSLKIEFLDDGVDLDWLFAKKTDPLLSLLSDNLSFVCAELGGNHVVNANRSAIGPWEKFSANDHNGGALEPGDEISLQTWNGLLLCAEYGGGGRLLANRRALGVWERFTILKTNGVGPIVDGDSIALRTQSGHYLTRGAGDQLDATGTTIGAAQTFTATFSAQ